MIEQTLRYEGSTANVTVVVTIEHKPNNDPVEVSNDTKFAVKVSVGMVKQMFPIWLSERQSRGDNPILTINPDND